MQDLPWRYDKTVTKEIQILKIDEECREIDALDIELNMPFILDVSEEIQIAELDCGKIYNAEIKFYTCELSSEMENQFLDTEDTDTKDLLQEGLDIIKSKGRRTLYKFELTSIRPP